MIFFLAGTQKATQPGSGVPRSPEKLIGEYSGRPAVPKLRHGGNRQNIDLGRGAMAHRRPGNVAEGVVVWAVREGRGCFAELGERVKEIRRRTHIQRGLVKEYSASILKGRKRKT